MSPSLAIGIDLGGTNIKGVLISADGDIIQQVDRPVPLLEDGREGDWKNEVKTILSWLKSRTREEVSAIGLAAPGIANSDSTAIAHQPVKLEGLVDFVWQDFLGERRVWVINDAHAALMGEVGFGVGQGFQNVVMLTLGTGVGGALYVNGELYLGRNQMAGHLGHISVNSQGPLDIHKLPGSLEDSVANSTVSKRTYGRFNSVFDLVQAYNSGDTLGTYFWLCSVRDLAASISGITNAVSPELVILGGGIANAREALFKPLQEFMNVYEWAPGGSKIEIVRAKFNEYAGAIGAASFALTKKS